MKYADWLQNLLAKNVSGMVLLISGDTDRENIKYGDRLEENKTKVVFISLIFQVSLIFFTQG